MIRLSEAALTHTTGAIASIDSGPVTLASRVADWCGRDTRAVHVVGIVDPDTAHHATETYRPTTAITRTVELRDQRCRFPHCPRPAHLCDNDHVVPHADGGATCDCQLVPLCRHHHRLKTHRSYHATVLEPGVLTWTTPHGHHYLVDHHGTQPLNSVVPSAVDPTTTTKPGHNGCLARAG